VTSHEPSKQEAPRTESALRIESIGPCGNEMVIGWSYRVSSIASWCLAYWLFSSIELQPTNEPWKKC